VRDHLGNPDLDTVFPDVRDHLGNPDLATVFPDHNFRAPGIIRG